jgi:glucose-1-phosphate adenylyltransferase
MRDLYTMILAGGRGERLLPLTQHRTKPAVPFGGKYRIIDITLSNCLNSGLRKIAVLIQYKSHSLDRHIRTGWSVFNPELGEFIMSVPPQQRISEEWYRGTADAVFQNLFLIDQERPRHLLVLAGDHVYKMNYADMYRYFLDTQADAVVGALEWPITEARNFGVLGVDTAMRVHRFEEKPQNPFPLPDDPSHAFISMGIYLFRTDLLCEELRKDAAQNTTHDFGKNIIPSMIKNQRVFAYNFQDENRKQVKYWRDIGTLDAYFEANMDLVSVDPLFNLYDQAWPIRTYQGQYPPAKFVFADDFEGGRRGMAVDSIVSGGCIISGSRVQNCVLSPNIHIEPKAEIRDSVIMENVKIGERSHIRRAIIDKGVVIPPDTIIGQNSEHDRQRFTVTEAGVAVVTPDSPLT